MTEERFIADNKYVMQNGQVYVVCDGGHSADVVATALNKLISENEQLKQQLDEQKERIKELLQDNDHKFWKLRFMHQFNSTSLIIHEITLAIEQGYEVSDKFKEYLNECKKQNEEGMKKANEQEKW